MEHFSHLAPTMEHPMSRVNISTSWGGLGGGACIEGPSDLCSAVSFKWIIDRLKFPTDLFMHGDTARGELATSCMVWAVGVFFLFCFQWIDQTLSIWLRRYCSCLLLKVYYRTFSGSFLIFLTPPSVQSLFSTCVACPASIFSLILTVSKRVTDNNGMNRPIFKSSYKVFVIIFGFTLRFWSVISACLWIQLVDWSWVSTVCWNEYYFHVLTEFDSIMVIQCANNWPFWCRWDVMLVKLQFGTSVCFQISGGLYSMCCHLLDSVLLI